MIDFPFQNECYSCTICASVCPVAAISFSKDLLPLIDTEKCVDCGKCESDCIRLNPNFGHPPKEENGYIAKNINDEIRNLSSSGGVFYALADYVLNQGGYVCGCIYDEKLFPKHVISNSREDVSKMRGSKYVTSDLRGCINEIIRLLDSNHKVLFSGVPCQCAAIDRIAENHNREDLIIVSVICHGSIDRSIWASYLNHEQKNSGKRIIAVSMRNKDKGWSNYGLKLDFEDGSSHISFRNEDGFFLRAYTSGLLERDRCLTCEYKEPYIHADMILGDGWGMDLLYPDFADEKGISVILVRTKKGEKLLGELSEELTVEAIAPELIYQNNSRVKTPAPLDVDRNLFFKNFHKHPEAIARYCKWYASLSLVNRLRRKIKQKMASRIYNRPKEFK